MAYAGPTVRSETSWGEDASAVTNHSAPYPATISAGDALIIAIFTTGSTRLPTMTDTDWTSIGLRGTASGSVRMYHKIADGTESGSAAFTTATSEFASYKMWSLNVPDSNGGTAFIGVPYNVYDTSAATTITVPSCDPISVDDHFSIAVCASFEGTTISSVGGSWGNLSQIAGPGTLSSGSATQQLDDSAARPECVFTFAGSVTGVGMALTVTDTYEGPVSLGAGADYGPSVVGVTSHPIPYPSAVDAGDYLIVVLGSGHYDQTFDIPSGWSLIAAYDAGVDEQVSMEIMATVADGTETGTLTITTNSAGSVSGKMLRTTKGGSTPGTLTVNEYESATTSYDVLGATTTPDPPSDTLDAVDDWILYGVICMDASCSVTATPEGWSSTIYNEENANLTMQLIHLQQRNYGTIDPPAITISAAQEGLAYSFALRAGPDAIIESKIRPVADTTGTDWDSAPTASQDLWAQVDEETASDTDYIYATDPNP